MYLVSYATGYVRQKGGYGAGYHRYNARKKHSWLLDRTPEEVARRLNGQEMSDGRRIPGIRSYSERDHSAPKGVIRYRYQIMGTGQEAPCYSVIDITIWPVHGPKGRLP